MPNSMAQDVLFLTNLQNESSSFDDFAGRLVTLCLIQRHKTCFSRQLCALSRPLVGDFAWRLVTLRLIQRHKSSFFSTTLHIESSSCWQSCTTIRQFTSSSTTKDVFSLTNLHNEWSSLRLIKLIQRQKTSFSRQLCVLRHPLFDDFCTSSRHFMSNSTSQDVFFKTTLRIETSSSWRFLHGDSSLYA